VVGPLVRGQGLEAGGVGPQEQRLVDGGAGAQRGDGGEGGEDRRGERDLLQERAPRSLLLLDLLVDRLVQLLGLDLGPFGHRSLLPCGGWWRDSNGRSAASQRERNSLTVG